MPNTQKKNCLPKKNSAYTITNLNKNKIIPEYPVFSIRY